MSKKYTSSEIYAMGLNPDYDHPTDELVPCQCGFKPNHWSIYYSKTPYDIVCKNCKKQQAFAKCAITGHHENAIDYWNKHIASLTLKQMKKEIKDFNKEKKKIEDKNYQTAREYQYYWYKNKGEILYQKW
jgi:ribosomal protein L34E